MTDQSITSTDSAEVISPEQRLPIAEGPLITVVVPVRNRATLVRRTLDSIQSQTNRDFILVIVDNGSTDATHEVLEAWAKENQDRLASVKIVDEPEAGASMARNRGLAEVTTPFVMFFDSDDEMRPRHMERVISEIAKHPDNLLFRWPLVILDSDGWSNVKDPYSSRLSELQTHILHCTYSTPRWSARTDMVRNAGGWNETLPTYEDYELGVRLLKAADGKAIVLTGEPTVVVNISDDSLSSGDYLSHAQDVIDSLAVIDRELEDKDARLTLRFRRAIYAALLRRGGDRILARRLMGDAMAGADVRLRMKLRLVYMVTRVLGRGGAALSQWLS